MSLYAYQVLNLVIEQGSFQSAAEMLYLTPSAISHIISKLEGDIGIKLLNRSRSGVSMTSSCEALLPHIQELISVDESLTQHIAQLKGAASGIIKLGTFNSVTVQWLPTLLRTFREKYPGIEIQVKQGSYNEIANWVSSNMVDLAFHSMAFTDQIKNKDVSVTPLCKDRFVCITPPDFAPAADSYVTVADLQEVPLVMQSSEYDMESKRFLDKYGLSSQSSFMMDEDTAVGAMVSAGFGVYIVTELIAAGLSTDLKKFPIEPEEYREICLLTSRPDMVTPAVELMTEHIKEYVEGI